MLKRRRFLEKSAHWVAAASLFGPYLNASDSSADYGPLILDPNKILDLPKGFSYKVISKIGETMSDGLPVPPMHDGVAAFPGENGTIRLVRNHEAGAQKADAEEPLLKTDKKEKLYDQGGPGIVVRGGTSTLVYDPQKKVLVNHFMSLAGTIRNCSGGPTPWNSWITCEETTTKVSKKCLKDHGFCFDVPSGANELVKPEPILGLGRFNHEAVAFDSRTGYVYETEDRPDGLLYRFLPKDRNDLHQGGQLQALCLADSPSADTTNRKAKTMEIGRKWKVKWVDVDNVLSPEDDLRRRGFAAGAAKFHGGEGLWFHDGKIIFTCKGGGKAGLGQTFVYRPEAKPSDRLSLDGTLELFLEPNNREQYNSGDNLTVSPSGDIYICEDGRQKNGVLRALPSGELYRFAMNSMNSSEMAGGCFSTDGKIFFVNIQKPGMTLAIHGPFV